GTQHIGISRRIEDPAERDRLRAIVEAERPPEGGFIVRTACEGVTKREIHDDVRFLSRLWGLVHKQAAAARSEEHTSELQSRFDLVCRLLLEKKKKSSCV